MYTHTPQLIPLFPLQLRVEVAESNVVLNVPGDSGEVDIWFFRRVQLYCRITQTYLVSSPLLSQKKANIESHSVYSTTHCGKMACRELSKFSPHGYRSDWWTAHQNTETEKILRKQYFLLEQILLYLNWQLKQMFDYSRASQTYPAGFIEVQGTLLLHWSGLNRL